jgi:type 1 glutamine amidotransferase
MHRLAIVLCLFVGIAASGCNVMRVYFPSSHHDSQPPEVPASLGAGDRPAILVFTKTNGFRHNEAIPAGLVTLQSLAEMSGWDYFHTENGAVHSPELLARFDAVVWHNTGGDTRDDPQPAARRAGVEAGGGCGTSHGAGGDSSYKWRWYVEELIGAQFIGHTMSPQFQEAVVTMPDRSHPAMRKLPLSWSHTEEWYSFAESPRAKGARVLLTVDESSYDPTGLFGKDVAMGEDHPVVWTRCVGKGRSFYSALGHQPEAYMVPQHVNMLKGAIEWAAGIHGSRCRGGR